MTKVRTIIFVMCMTLLAGQLFAGGFALTGVGSRATSMAGAFRGLSDDPSAMYWNPAGLGFMNENSFSLGGTFIYHQPPGIPVEPLSPECPDTRQRSMKLKRVCVCFPQPVLP